MRTLDQKFYDKKYYTECCEGHEDWNSFGPKKLSPRLEAAYRLAKITQKTRVLDFGSGRGEMAYQAAVDGATVTGLDYSKAAIDLTKKIKSPKGGKLSFELLKGHRIPLEDHSIDVIFFVDVIEHLYPEEVRAVLSEFKRVLSRNGKVVMHTAPNKDFYDYGYRYFTRFANILANLFIWPVVFQEKLITNENPRNDEEKLVHINECSPKMVKDFFEEAGFSTKVWLSSDFRLIRLRDKLRYIFLQPQIGVLKRWFAYDIWVIAKV